jgi:hypothetical protein
MAAAPPVALVRHFDTHRLIPSYRSPSGESVLADIADDDAHLQAIFEIDAATNDRLLARRLPLPGIGADELVSAVPYAHVVNASFCHPHPLGARFSSPTRGAWYAAFDVATAQREVGFHRSVQLAEIGRLDDTVTFDDYLADFSASFHDLRRARQFKACLDPGSYVASQALAETLLEAGSLGVVYPSVRQPGGTCVACFRPAVVSNVRRAQTWRFTWKDSLTPVVARVAVPPA